MAKSKIEWTEKTWNPVTGCTKISPGCAHCYAERMSKRLAGRFGYPADEPFRVTVHEDKMAAPLRWREPSRVFVCSMGDLFHEAVPFEVIDRIWAVMAMAQQHTFQVLTKRSDRMCEYLLSRTSIDDSGRVDRSPQWYGVVTSLLDEGAGGPLGNAWDRCHDGIASVDVSVPLPNVWLGVTVEDQQRADERIPDLLATPAAVRFVSVEPMLGPVDLYNANRDYLGGLGRSGGPVIQKGLDWVIVGGETGPGARPMHPDWARSLRDQCQAAGTPFFFKQQITDGGKTRLLDGREWNQMPGKGQ